MKKEKKKGRGNYQVGYGLSGNNCQGGFFLQCCIEAMCHGSPEVPQ